MILEEFLEEETKKKDLMYLFSVYLLNIDESKDKSEKVREKIKLILKGVVIISKMLEEQKKKIKKMKINNQEKKILFNFLIRQTKALIEIYKNLTSFKHEEDYKESKRIEDIKVSIEEYKPIINETIEFLKAISFKRVNKNF